MRLSILFLASLSWAQVVQTSNTITASAGQAVCIFDYNSSSLTSQIECSIKGITQKHVHFIVLNVEQGYFQNISWIIKPTKAGIEWQFVADKESKKGTM